VPVALIVGAGIGGLAAGIALRRAGREVRVFERADAPRELGFGIGLASYAVAALDELGVDAVRSLIFRPASAEVRRVGGPSLRRFDRELTGSARAHFPGVVLRPALHGALLDTLGRGLVEVNREVVDLVSAPDRVQLVMRDRTTAEGDIVVGADGIHSTVRQRLHPTEPPAQPSGYVAVRGASPNVAAMDGLQALWYFGHGLESGVIRVHDVVYWFVSLLADDVVALRGDAGGIVKKFTADFDAQFHAITGATPPTHLRFDELLVRPALTRWGHGRATLLGDAAHPMLPHTGQGAAQAIEDAVVLADCLQKADAGSVPQALQRYEAIRRPRTSQVQLMSRGREVRNHLPDGPEQERRDRELASGDPLRQSAWLYGHDAERVDNPLSRP